MSRLRAAQGGHSGPGHLPPLHRHPQPSAPPRPRPGAEPETSRKPADSRPAQHPRPSSAGSPRCPACPAICAAATGPRTRPGRDPSPEQRQPPLWASPRSWASSSPAPRAGLWAPPGVRAPLPERGDKAPPPPGGHPPRCARRSQAEGSAGSRPPPRCPGPKRGVRGPFGAAFRVGDAGRQGRRLVLSGARRRLTAQLRGRAHPAPPASLLGFLLPGKHPGAPPPAPRAGAQGDRRAQGTTSG